MLNYEYPPLGGGAANATAYLLAELSKQGIYVDLVTAAIGQQAELVQPMPHTRILRLPVGVRNMHYQSNGSLLAYTLATAARLPLLLKHTRYDLVHAFFALPCGSLAYLLRHRLPYLISLRGSDVPGFSARFDVLHRTLQPLNRQVWEAADAVVANSEGLRELALRSFPQVQIDVIPNGIDTRLFRPRLAAQASDPLRVLCVARLIPRKRIDDLLEAIALLHAQGRSVMLDVAGTGQLADDLNAIATRLGISSTVTWHGYVSHDELPELYAQADVFVLPSLQEGMSNTVLEALAAGLPVIVTQTGGTAELVDGNGYIVPTRNPRAIADALAQLIDQPDIRQRMGERSRILAEQMSWSAIAEAYVQRYQAILRGA